MGTWKTMTGVVEWRGQASALLDTIEVGLSMRGMTHIEGVMVQSHNGRFWTWEARCACEGDPRE